MRRNVNATRTEPGSMRGGVEALRKGIAPRPEASSAPVRRIAPDAQMREYKRLLSRDLPTVRRCSVTATAVCGAPSGRNTVSRPGPQRGTVAQ